MATRKRIFCDTNFLLDLCDAERSLHEDALALAWYAELHASTVKLVAAISSFKDAYYILARLYKNESAARDSVKAIMEHVVFLVDMLASYGTEAMQSDEPDFEDGIIRACAEHEDSSVIISNDKSAFSNSPIPKQTASEFLSNEGFDYSIIDW